MVQDVRGATCRQTSIYPDPNVRVSPPRPGPVAILSRTGNSSDTRHDRVRGSSEVKPSAQPAEPVPVRIGNDADAGTELEKDVERGVRELVGDADHATDAGAVVVVVVVVVQGHPQARTVVQGQAALLHAEHVVVVPEVIAAEVKMAAVVVARARPVRAAVKVVTQSELQRVRAALRQLQAETGGAPQHKTDADIRRGIRRLRARRRYGRQTEEQGGGQRGDPG